VNAAFELWAKCSVARVTLEKPEACTRASSEVRRRASAQAMVGTRQRARSSASTASRGQWTLFSTLQCFLMSRATVWRLASSASLLVMKRRQPVTSGRRCFLSRTPRTRQATWRAWGRAREARLGRCVAERAAEAAAESSRSHLRRSTVAMERKMSVPLRVSVVRSKRGRLREFPLRRRPTLADCP